VEGQRPHCKVISGVAEGFGVNWKLRVQQKGNVAKDSLDDDSIIVQGGCSDDEKPSRGRARFRFKQSEISSRPLSPLLDPSLLRRSQAGARYEHYEMPEIPRPRRREPNGKSSVPLYQNTSVSDPRLHSEDRHRRYGRRCHAQYMGEDAMHDHAGSQVESTAQDGGRSSPTTSNRDNSFDFSSSRSRTSAQRRRQERANPEMRSVSQEREQNAVLSQLGGESSFVTDPYVYHARMPSNSEEDRQQYEHFHSANLEPQRSTNRFPTQDYAYYQDNWAKDNYFLPVEEPIQSRHRSPHRYGDYFQIFELSDSEPSIDHVKPSMHLSI
jgi:hypothetical protein